jgi:hypothetical protein
MNRNIIALALICSVSSVAVARKSNGNMITITNKNKDVAYDKAAIQVEFKKGQHLHEGWVEAQFAKGVAKADLLQATDHRKGSETLLAKYYNKDAQGLHIYVRSINVGPEDANLRSGPSKGKGRAAGDFVKSGPTKGTMARHFVVEGQDVKAN